MMRRVMVLGAPGSGKSTLAMELGERLGAPIFHLDRFYHRPGWIEPPADEFAGAVAALAAHPAWVIDGNYPATAAPRLAAADTIVFLDAPRGLRLVRVIWRVLRHHGRERPDSAEGCPERLDLAFLRYVWRWDKQVSPSIRAMLYGFGGRTVVLDSRAAVARFLSDCR